MCVEPGASLASIDASRETALRDGLVVLQQAYFTGGVPGLPVDPEGNAGRAAAQDGAAALGDLFPLQQPLKTSDGSSANIRPLLDRGPVVVTFFRGNFCTLCKIALRHLNQCRQLLYDTYGASLIAISGQLPKYNRVLEVENSLEYPVLCDKELALARQLGIVYSLTSQEARFYDYVCKTGFDDVYGKGHAYRLPLPATFVLEQGTGRIAYAFVDADLTKRSRLLMIEAALQSLRDGGG